MSFIFGKELEIRKILSESHLYSSAFFTEYKDIIDDLQKIYYSWSRLGDMELAFAK